MVSGGAASDAAADNGDVVTRRGDVGGEGDGGGGQPPVAVDSGISARYTKPQIGSTITEKAARREGIEQVKLEGAEMTSSFHGAYTVCVTPFTEDGSHVDTGAFRRFLSWQIEVGVPGVIILGTTGEYLTVSDEERAELVGTAVSHVAGRVPVLVGTR